MNSFELDKLGAEPFEPPFQNTIELELSDEEIDFLEEQIPYLMVLAWKEAYHETLAAGLSVLCAKDDKLWEVFPDGSRRFLKDLAPGVDIPVGTYKIRWKNR